MEMAPSSYATPVLAHNPLNATSTSTDDVDSRALALPYVQPHARRHPLTLGGLGWFMS